MGCFQGNSRFALLHRDHGNLGVDNILLYLELLFQQKRRLSWSYAMSASPSGCWPMSFVKLIYQRCRKMLHTTFKFWDTENSSALVCRCQRTIMCVQVGEFSPLHWLHSGFSKNCINIFQARTALNWNSKKTSTKLKWMNWEKSWKSKVEIQQLCVSDPFWLFYVLKILVPR